MDKKLLMKVGIGAGVLVLGFLAYKKFVAKPKDTKSAEAEPEEETAVKEETKAEPTKPTATTKSTKIEKPQSTSEDISLGGGKMQKSRVKEMLKKGQLKGLGKEIKASATYTPQSTSEPISLGDGRMQISQDRQDAIKEQRKATFEKYGLNESEVEKLQDENRRIGELQMQNTKLTDDEKRAQRFDFLRKFGKERNLNAEGYIKMLEAMREKIIAKKAERAILTGKTSFAGFMDFDGNDDVQGSIM